MYACAFSPIAISHSQGYQLIHACTSSPAHLHAHLPICRFAETLVRRSQPANARVIRLNLSILCSVAGYVTSRCILKLSRAWMQHTATSHHLSLGENGNWYTSSLSCHPTRQSRHHNQAANAVCRIGSNPGRAFITMMNQSPTTDS